MWNVTDTPSSVCNDKGPLENLADQGQNLEKSDARSEGEVDRVS